MLGKLSACSRLNGKLQWTPYQTNTTVDISGLDYNELLLEINTEIDGSNIHTNFYIIKPQLPDTAKTFILGFYNNSLDNLKIQIGVSKTQVKLYQNYYAGINRNGAITVFYR